VEKESTLAGICSTFFLEICKKIFLEDNDVDGRILYYYIFQIKGEGGYKLECITPSRETDIEFPVSHNRLGISQSAEQIEIPHKGLILLCSVVLLSSNTEKYCPPLIAFLRVHRIDLSFPNNFRWRCFKNGALKISCYGRSIHIRNDVMYRSELVFRSGDVSFSTQVAKGRRSHILDTFETNTKQSLAELRQYFFSSANPLCFIISLGGFLINWRFM
jgi:hypothetical protein